MHILYVHQNFPAQFGHIAAHLVRQRNWRCTFVSQTPAGQVKGIEKISYEVRGGATVQNHFCSRTFENTVWHCDGVFEALRRRPDIQPDLIVGHSGFGSTLFLRELYPQAPVVNFFEYYYRAHNSDMDFRVDLPWGMPQETLLRAYCRNAMILLDMQNCQAAYTPTQFQRSCFPAEYRDRLEVIFDGVDRAVYHGHDEALRPPLGNRPARTVGGVSIPAGARVLTYVSRGFESMRGFDIFMRAARLIAQRDREVFIIVVGTDRIAYGGDENHIAPHRTFRHWVLAQDEYDLSRFVFPGYLHPRQLAELLAATDLHIYLTVPFVLSWSMMNAMSCGAVVLGSRTAPVEELITDGQNGLLADFFSPEDFAEKALAVLADPAAHRPLGRAAEEKIRDRYSLDAVLPRMVELYERAASVQLPPVRMTPAPQPPVPPPQAPQSPAPPSRSKSPFYG